MKRISSIIAMALIAVLSLTFTSCDEDSDIAYTLEGTWEGNMYVQSSYNGQTYDATYSEICFTQDPYTYSSGTGYWVDHYSSNGWGRNYVANHIQWTVSNSRIQIYFVEENTTIWIEDYQLNDNYFEGRIYDGSNTVNFQLTHTSSPNWSSYDYGWGSYAKSRSGVATSTERPIRSFKTK
jgi:hypothetical protein